jgi:hypothetical protein
MITGLIFVAGAYVFGLLHERLAGHRPSGLDGATLAGGAIGIAVCGLLLG